MQATLIPTPGKHHPSLSTYSAEVFVGAGLPTKPALQQHVLQLVAESTHHLRGVDEIIRGRGVVLEVQQIQESWFMAFFQDGQAPFYDSVVRIHEVHPVTAVIQVVLSHARCTKHILVAERDSWEGHIVSPNHVDLCDSRVGHQVEDPVHGPGAEKTYAKKEGQSPDELLWF